MKCNLIAQQVANRDNCTNISDVVVVLAVVVVGVDVGRSQLKR